MERTLRVKSLGFHVDATGFRADGSINVDSCYTRGGYRSNIRPAYVAWKTLGPFTTPAVMMSHHALYNRDKIGYGRPTLPIVGWVESMKMVIDLNGTCIGFLTLACAPYAADNDGDDGEFHVLTNENSVQVCDMSAGIVMRSYSIRNHITTHNTKGIGAEREVVARHYGQGHDIN